MAAPHAVSEKGAEATPSSSESLAADPDEGSIVVSLTSASRTGAMDHNFILLGVLDKQKKMVPDPKKLIFQSSVSVTNRLAYLLLYFAKCVF